MAQQRQITKGIFAWLISIVAMGSVAAAQGTIDLTAKIIRVKGSARYSTGNNVWQPLRVGASLQPGSIIETTSENSYVDIVLGVAPTELWPSSQAFKPFTPSSYPTSTSYKPTASGNAVRLWGNSVLGLGKLTMQDTGTGPITETMLDLKQGRLSGIAKKISPASKFEIKLPKGVASIRGTVFELLAEGVVKVVQGAVTIAWASQPGANVVTQLVQSHQKYDARTGELTPLAPEEAAASQHLEAELMVVELGPPPNITTDHTIINISPVGAN
jgi:hypothetical protein